MFSSSISKNNVLSLRKSIKDKSKALYRILGKINKELLDIKKYMKWIIIIWKKKSQKSCKYY